MQIFEEETEGPSEGTWLVSLALAGCVFWLWVIAMAYSYGAESQAGFAITSLARADTAVVALARCVDVSARAMSEVLLRDPYLYMDLRTMADNAP